MKVVIWDFDGTIGERIGAWSGTICEMISEEFPHLQPTREQVRPALKGKFLWDKPEIPHPELADPDRWWDYHLDLIRDGFVAGGLAPDAAAMLAARFRTRYCSLAGWRIFDQTEAALGMLERAGWRHYILSNHVPELEQIVIALGIRERFDGLYNSALTGYEKPHPQAFAQIASRIPGGSRIWMVGDSYEADFLGAERAGLTGVLVHKTREGVVRQSGDLMGVVRLITGDL